MGSKSKTPLRKNDSRLFDSDETSNISLSKMTQYVNWEEVNKSWAVNEPEESLDIGDVSDGILSNSSIDIPKENSIHATPRHLRKRTGNQASSVNIGRGFKKKITNAEMLNGSSKRRKSMTEVNEVEDEISNIEDDIEKEPKTRFAKRAGGFSKKLENKTDETEAFNISSMSEESLITEKRVFRGFRNKKSCIDIPKTMNAICNSAAESEDGGGTSGNKQVSNYSTKKINSSHDNTFEKVFKGNELSDEEDIERKLKPRFAKRAGGFSRRIDKNKKLKKEETPAFNISTLSEESLLIEKRGSCFRNKKSGSDIPKTINATCNSAVESEDEGGNSLTSDNKRKVSGFSKKRVINSNEDNTFEEVFKLNDEDVNERQNSLGSIKSIQISAKQTIDGIDNFEEAFDDTANSNSKVGEVSSTGQSLSKHTCNEEFDADVSDKSDISFEEKSQNVSDSIEESEETSINTVNSHKSVEKNISLVQSFSKEHKLENANTSAKSNQNLESSRESATRRHSRSRSIVHNDVNETWARPRSTSVRKRQSKSVTRNNIDATYDSLNSDSQITDGSTRSYVSQISVFEVSNKQNERNHLVDSLECSVSSDESDGGQDYLLQIESSSLANCSSAGPPPAVITDNNSEMMNRCKKKAPENVVNSNTSKCENKRKSISRQTDEESSAMSLVCSAFSEEVEKQQESLSNLNSRSNLRSSSRLRTTSIQINDVGSVDFEDTSEKVAPTDLTKKSEDANKTEASYSQSTKTKNSKRANKTPPFSEVLQRRKRTEHNDVSNLKHAFRFAENDSNCSQNAKVESVKVPKLKKPKKWVTNSLYNFVIKKLEPQYGLKSRVRAERFVDFLCNTIETVTAKKENYKVEVDELKIEMARLKIINTLFEFYDFIETFLPWEFCDKSVPYLRPCNEPMLVNSEKMGLHENIL